MRSQQHGWNGLREVEMDKQQFIPVQVFDYSGNVLTSNEAAALAHFDNEIRLGRPWGEVLLEAIGMWTISEEWFNGRYYKYVIQNEAFDWLVLAERLCENVMDMVSSAEIESLLFKGLLPFDLRIESSKHVVGYNKYRGILNFWYGVVAEETLHLIIEDEVRKDMHAGGRTDVEDLDDTVFKRLYDDNRSNLLKRFAEETGGKVNDMLSVVQYREFTYWLFKLRVKYWDPARVASDTRKALEFLNQFRHDSVVP